MIQEKYQRIIEKNMGHVWDSWEWLLKEKLTSIDNMARNMITEMKLVGATEEMLGEFLPQQFELLKQQVVATQNVYHEKQRKPRGRRALA